MAQARIASLNDVQLREELGTFGYNSPPVTPNTRLLLEKKLLCLLEGKAMISDTPMAGDASDDEANNTPDNPAGTVSQRPHAGIESRVMAALPPQPPPSVPDLRPRRQLDVNTHESVSYTFVIIGLFCLVALLVGAFWFFSASKSVPKLT